MLVLRPPAKVNLFLRVLAREDSGFHQIETLFQAIDFRDRLEIEAGEGSEGGEVELEVTGAELGPMEENLVWRAASTFLAALELDAAVHLRLEKRIPQGAGLGGGSSDAASTLLGLNRLFGNPLEPDALTALSAELGSDVSFFLSPSPLALGWGRGNRLLPLPPLVPKWIVLALPQVRIETAGAYRALAEQRSGSGRGDGAEHLPVGGWRGHSSRSSCSPSREEVPGRAGARTEAGTAEIFPFGFPRDWDEIATFAHNDFERVIFEREALLEDVRDRLKSAGAKAALLSGSGAALFALYDSEAEARGAADSVSSSLPHVRLEVTRTLSVFERL